MRRPLQVKFVPGKPLATRLRSESRGGEASIDRAPNSGLWSPHAVPVYPSAATPRLAVALVLRRFGWAPESLLSDSCRLIRVAEKAESSTVKSRRVQMAIGAGLAALLLWLFLRQVDLAAVATELRQADYRWVLLGTLLTLLVTVHRAVRWHYLLLPIKSISLAPLTATTFMGWAFTGLLPGRLGEVARPVLLGRREDISKTAAFATIVLERLFDLLSVLLILVTYLLFFPLPAGVDAEAVAIVAAMRLSGIAALIGLLVAVAFLAGAQLMPRRTDALLVRVFGWLPGSIGERLLPFAQSFLSGFAGIRSPRLLATIVVHSLLIWLNILVTYYALLFAFDIVLPPHAVMPLIVMVVIGVMVPTPAAVGGFHVAAQLALVGLWGVPPDRAASYAIVCHAVVFVPITLVGIVLLAREGLTWRGIGELEASELDA